MTLQDFIKEKEIVGITKQKIIVETPNGSVELKIGDALIYEGMGGEIVIDSE